MKKVCFLIRQFNLGGAQRQLLELVKGLDKSSFDVTVMTFYDGGHYCEEIKRLPGVRYHCLNKGGRWDVLGFVARLLKCLKKEKPDILFSFLGFSNILSVLVKPFFPKIRIVWSVRGADRDFKQVGRLDHFGFFLECRLSRFSDLIVANSYAGKAFAAGRGFPDDKVVVIPNGIDSQRFRPSSDERDHVRSEWAAGQEVKLIGAVGRIHPIKGYPFFIRAAAKVLENRQDVRFVFIGDGEPNYLQELRILASSLGVDKYCLWMGSRQDMPSVYNALDILVSSSQAEGFSNVIGEAMACNLPCVVTDVGDSALIVGDTGIVVPSGDPDALADGIGTLLKLLESECQKASPRQRIGENFSVAQMIKATEAKLWEIF